MEIGGAGKTPRTKVVPGFLVLMPFGEQGFSRPRENERGEETSRGRRQHPDVKTLGGKIKYWMIANILNITRRKDLKLSGKGGDVLLQNGRWRDKARELIERNKD